MLILERAIDESIIIYENEEVKVTVLEIKGRQVKLGIQAPKGISIHRKEIYERLKDSNLSLKEMFNKKSKEKEYK